jgi:hypothetical protein
MIAYPLSPEDSCLDLLRHFNPVRYHYIYIYD